MNANVIKLDNVRKTYEMGESSVHALKGVSLSVEEGEFVTVTGASGSGKSTLMHILGCLDTPSEGHYSLGSEDVSSLSREDLAEIRNKKIGFVFQGFNLLPRTSAAENVEVPLLYSRPLESASIRKQKALDALNLMRLDDRASHHPNQLSGGQQQRIALARALVFEPELVLMDEPLGALDKQLREHMQYEIKHIHENLGVTVVYVTHDQSEALTMSNRIAVFDDGIIQQLADPVTLYEKPENAFVAQFIGENNTLAGTVTSLSGGVASVTLDSGDAVKALAINTDGKGSATQLSVRPERCVVTPKKKAGLSSLKGRIEELIYLGDHIRCRMTVAGNDEFIVKVPNTADQLGLQIGAESYVGWQTDDCRALDVKDA